MQLKTTFAAAQTFIFTQQTHNVKMMSSGLRCNVNLRSCSPLGRICNSSICPHSFLDFLVMSVKKLMSLSNFLNFKSKFEYHSEKSQYYSSGKIDKEKGHHGISLKAIKSNDIKIFTPSNFLQ